ncbi:SAM-dependent methyltransferase [Georgenia sp. AZ-5]|uniref:SAM-dependent methyltransferase n=1 Tax=Georgenia sp. AZ-5 TaxID=3367526 RepID=UPI0037549812
MAISLRAVAQVAGAGDVRERLRVIRDGQAALRVATVHAGLSTGVLEALRTRRTTEELAAALGATDLPLLESFLRALAVNGLVVTTPSGHVLTRRGRAVLGDDVVRAGYEAFGGFHTDLYRDLPAQLAGGPGRRDVEERGDVIARLSRAMEPLVRDALAAQVRAVAPRRVLDVGCGEGSLLAHMLAVAPGATGIGAELDDGAATRAEERLAAPGLARRATVFRGDVRRLLAAPEALRGPVDLVLLANVLYYVPPADRAEFLGSLAAELAPGGRIVIISTMAEPSAFSRHFALLLQAQAGRMQLPTPAEVEGVLRGLGLEVVTSRRVVPGAPLHLVAARRPA